MLDKGKTPVEVNYPNEYVTFEDLMQASSELSEPGRGAEDKIDENTLMFLDSNSLA